MALIFQKTSEIRTSVEALFRFHQDPANLERINPPGVRVAKLRLPKHWKAGARLGVTVEILGMISQEWEVSLETVSPPCRLVDVAIRGPYPKWRHIHEFREVGPRLSSLTDRVEYLPPVGTIRAVARPLGFPAPIGTDVCLAAPANTSSFGTGSQAKKNLREGLAGQD